MNLIITYFRRLGEIKFSRKKGAAKIKDAELSNLHKNLYLSVPSATWSVHTRRRVQISVQRMSLCLIMIT